MCVLRAATTYEAAVIIFTFLVDIISLVASLRVELQSVPVAPSHYSRAPHSVAELFTTSRKCSSASSAGSRSSGRPLSPHTC